MTGAASDSKTAMIGGSESDARPEVRAEDVAPTGWEAHSGLPAGVLPVQLLRQAEARHIVTVADGSDIPKANFQPASLDLRLGDRAYRIRTSFLPGDYPVAKRLRDFQLDRGLDIRGGGILEPKRPYLIPLMERLRLPDNVRAHTNPKSSTGRVDIFTRVVADLSHRFDEIPAGYHGDLWLEVFTRSFLVRVKAGMTLNQLRLIVNDPSDAGANPARPAIDSGLETLRIDLGSPGASDAEESSEPNEPRPVGFRAKTNNSTLLDLEKRDHDPRDFWEPLWPTGGLVLEPEDFYLLRSRERVAIGSDVAAEMVAFDPTSGELRTHYAGFFDPGFGVTSAAGGSPAVLEVRAHDVPFMLEDGQEVAKLKYEKLAEAPDLLYGADGTSHYAGSRQWQFLSKHFRPFSGRQLSLEF